MFEGKVFSRNECNLNKENVKNFALTLNNHDSQPENSSDGNLCPESIVVASLKNLTIVPVYPRV